MCAPISDGAAAVVLCTAKGLRRLGAQRRAIRVSVAEVHDATAVGEVIQVENLGLCGQGEGGIAALHGDTSLGGHIPVNPSGGLEGKGHPIGATGLGQIFELVQ
jgi:acetyl-CoA acetyltransferase